jgi:hypothetical protein
MQYLKNTTARLYYKRNTKYQLVNQIAISGFNIDTEAIQLPIGVAIGEHSTTEITFSSIVRANRYSLLYTAYADKSINEFIVAIGDCAAPSLLNEAGLLYILRGCVITSYEITDLQAATPNEADLVKETVTISINSIILTNDINNVIYSTSSVLSSICIYNNEVYASIYTGTNTELLYSSDGITWLTILLTNSLAPSADLIKHSLHVDVKNIYLFIGNTLYLYDRPSVLTATAAVLPISIVFPSDIIDIYSYGDWIWAISQGSLYKIHTPTLSFERLTTPIDYIIGLVPYTFTGISGVGDNIVISQLGESFVTNANSGTFRMVTSGALLTDFLTVAVCNANTFLFGTDDKKLVLVSDLGNGFNQESVAVLDSNVTDICFITNDIGYVCTMAGTVYKTFDSGRTVKALAHTTYPIKELAAYLPNNKYMALYALSTNVITDLLTVAAPNNSKIIKFGVRGGQ